MFCNSSHTDQIIIGTGRIQGKSRARKTLGAFLVPGPVSDAIFSSIDGHLDAGCGDTPPTVSNIHVAVTHSGVTIAPIIGRYTADEVLHGSRIEMLAPLSA